MTGYTLEDLACMTGYSTRSLRSFYRRGLLTGTMEAGRYVFSEEDLADFFARPFIGAGIRTKGRMQVEHFMEEMHTDCSAACLVHDEPGRERAEGLNRSLLEYINGGCEGELTYRYYFDAARQAGRFIVTGQAEEVAAMMERIGKSREISS